MDIIEQLKLKTLNGFPLERLRNILNDEDEVYKVSRAVGEYIFLTEREHVTFAKELKSINCINNYYIKAGEEKPFKAPKVQNKCEYIRRHYGIDAGSFQCKKCHLCMIDKNKKREVSLK